MEYILYRKTYYLLPLIILFATFNHMHFIEMLEFMADCCHMVSVKTKRKKKKYVSEKIKLFGNVVLAKLILIEWGTEWSECVHMTQ